MAEHKNWILFFDEADALFGKRTQVQDSHDRFANQEISFLLQRIEEFHGVVILTSNIKTNIDEAFLRRFHSVIQFPMPRPAERLRIWQNAFSPKAVMEKSVDLDAVADKYNLSGGTIMNVVRYLRYERSAATPISFCWTISKPAFAANSRRKEERCNRWPNGNKSWKRLSISPPPGQRPFRQPLPAPPRLGRAASTEGQRQPATFLTRGIR